MARRKVVAAVEKDEEVRVTRATRSRAAKAAQQAPPSSPPPPPPPPAPRGRTTIKSASRKRKSSVSSDEDDELATKKANIRTTPSPAPPINRGRKAAVKNARGRREEMDVEEPPIVETEHESGQNLPIEEGRENVEVEAEVMKPKKAGKAPARKRGMQKKVEVEVEPEMSATDDADDGEASAVVSSMLIEDKTDTPPSSFLVQEDSGTATEGVKVPAEEPEEVKKAPTRKRGAKKMEIASEPAELKVEASEETTAANVEKPKAKRGRKPGQKAAKKGGRKAPAVKAEAQDQTSIEGPGIEGGTIQEGSLEEADAEGTAVDKSIISGAGVQVEKDGDIRIEEAPADQVLEAITDVNADIEVTKIGEAGVQEPEADTAVAGEAILEETAVNIAALNESAVGELTVEGTTFDKAPEIEMPMVEEGAKAEEVEAEEMEALESKAELAEAKEVMVKEPVVEEAALEHAALEDAIVDKSIDIEVTRAEEARMVEKIVEAVSVDEVDAGGSGAGKAIVGDTTLGLKAAEAEVCEVVEEEITFQQPMGPDGGDTMGDMDDDTTAPTVILAGSTNDETGTTTSTAVEPMGNDTIGSIAVGEAEDTLGGQVCEGEEGQLGAERGAKNPDKSSPSVVDAAGSDVGAEIKDGSRAPSSLKRKAKGRLSEPARGRVADSVRIDASHKRRSTGGGLPLPKRRRVTPPPMQPPSTPATISPSPRKVASPSTESTPRSTGPLTTPVKPLGPFLMPPATPEAVAGIGRSPTKGSIPLGLLLDDGDGDGDDGATVTTTEGARRWGQEMAQKHLQQYQGVFEKLRANFELSEGFQQSYQGVMRHAFPLARPSPGRAGLSPSPSALLAFEGHGLDDGDDSFDRSFNRAVSPDRSSIIWAWDIEHEGAGSREGGSDDADDEDEAREVMVDQLHVEEKASITVIMDAPRYSNILEPTEVQEVVMSDRPTELELVQELGGAEKSEEVAMTLTSDGGEIEDVEEAEDGEKEEGGEIGDRGSGLSGELEGSETEGEDFESEAGYLGKETEDSGESMETEIDGDEAEQDRGMEEPEILAGAESLMNSEGSVGTCNPVKPSRLRLPAAKALKLSKAPRIPVPASRVATVKMRKVSVASLKDVPISEMTPHELASTTNTCTARNKLYSCDFTRRVIHKYAPRPPSPNAKAQTLKASQDRARRRAIQEETGVILGPGDEENFDPNPSAKVRWGHPLESEADYEERKSPSQVKGLLPRPSILSRSAQLSKHGNILTPPTEIAIERTKVTINKILYRGEKK